MPVKLPSPSLASAHGTDLHSSPFVALLSRTTCIAEADATAENEITLFLAWTAARFVKDQCTRFGAGEPAAHPFRVQLTGARKRLRVTWRV
jgi:hypothetical protein